MTSLNTLMDQYDYCKGGVQNGLEHVWISGFQEFCAGISLWRYRGVTAIAETYIGGVLVGRTKGKNAVAVHNEASRQLYRNEANRRLN